MTDYDTAVIRIDPHGVATHADRLIDLTTDVANLIEQVANTIFPLKLGWAGKTADEVQQFNNNWTSVMSELFGTTDTTDTNPSDAGVLNVMSQGLKAIAEGFDQVEQQLATGFGQMFSGLLNSVNDGAPPTPTSAPASANDPNDTAVAENFGPVTINRVPPKVSS